LTGKCQTPVTEQNDPKPLATKVTIALQFCLHSCKSS